MTAVSTTSITDLIRFLIARVEDDDAQLKKEARAESRSSAAPTQRDAMRSSARLRAENAAKREVIASAQQLLVLRDQPSEKPVRDNAAHILQAMANTYSDHPSFRSSWQA